MITNLNFKGNFPGITSVNDRCRVINCSCFLYQHVVLCTFFTGGTVYCQGCHPCDIGWTDANIAPDHCSGGFRGGARGARGAVAPPLPEVSGSTKE